MRRARPHTPSEVQSRNALVGDVLHSAAIETVFDIHPGSCAVGVMLRQCGYSERIVTFEPNEQVWEQLRYCSMTDEEWILSRSAISIRDEVLLPEKALPIVGTRLDSAVEVFCQEDEVIAVWLSRPSDGELVTDILRCPRVRTANLACLIGDTEHGELSVEKALQIVRQEGWEVIAVHSREEDGNRLPVADVLVVRAS